MGLSPQQDVVTLSMFRVCPDSPGGVLLLCAEFGQVSAQGGPRAMAPARVPSCFRGRGAVHKGVWSQAGDSSLVPPTP